jgi:hypothetical protein
MGKEVRMPDQAHPLLSDDRDLDDDRDDRDESNDDLPESVQPTLTEHTATLDQLSEQEPTDDRGTVQVLVSSGTRSRFHQQDIHAAGEPACGQKLSADRTRWVPKPKGAMRRSSVEPCPECYPGGDVSDGE